MEWETPQKSKKKLDQQAVEHQQDPSAVLFVARSTGGELVKRLRQDEEYMSKLTKHRIGIVERPGQSLKNHLWN